MCQAAHLRDAAHKPGFVACVIIANQTTLPFAQKGPAMLTRSGFAEVVDHSLQILKSSGCVGPQVDPVCLLVARF